MQNLKSSVAMATYNGEKYIYDQLLSIYNQTRIVDEVVICDDCSTDNTVEIIRNFINEYKLNSTWHLYINKNNKGYVKNFIDCAIMTTGDVVFYSDQDDLWDKNKIEKMMQKFENNKKIKGILCSFKCINDKEEICDTLLNKIRRGKEGKFYKVDFESQVKNTYCGGLTLAIKSNELEWLSKIILENGLSHDVPVGLFLSAENGFYRLQETLVYRRVHDENVSEPKYTLKSRISNIEYHIKGRKIYLKLIETCYEYYKNKDILSKKDLSNLRSNIELTKRSIYNLENKKTISLLYDIFSINPMANKILSIVNFTCSLFGKY